MTSEALRDHIAGIIAWAQTAPGKELAKLDATNSILQLIATSLPEYLPDRKERDRLYAEFPDAIPWIAGIRADVLDEIHRLLGGGE